VPYHDSAVAAEANTSNGRKPGQPAL